MDLDTICQWIVLASTCMMSLLVCSGNGHKRFWGFVVGLCGQPLWFYITIHNQQWPIMILTMLFTYTHIRGIYTHRVFSKWRIKDKKGLEL